MNNISKGQKKREREPLERKPSIRVEHIKLFSPDSNCKWYLFREALLLGMILHGHHFTR